jgi:hypothetical protein
LPSFCSIFPPVWSRIDLVMPFCQVCHFLCTLKSRM